MILLWTFSAIVLCTILAPTNAELVTINRGWRVIVKSGPHFPVNINSWAIQWTQQIQTCGRLCMYILHAAAPTPHRTVGVGVVAHISIIQILPWFFPTCTRAHADLVLTLFWGPQASDASDRYLFIIHSWESLKARRDNSGYNFLWRRSC